MARWRASNPERYLEAMRRYRAKNRDKEREISKRRYWANPELSRQRMLKYRQSNRAVIAVANNSGGRITEDVRRFAAAMNKGCKYCGGSKHLQVDHIVPRSKGGADEIANLQWLCRQCNHMKYDMTEEQFFEHVLKLVARHGAFSRPCDLP